MLPGTHTPRDRILAWPRSNHVHRDGFHALSLSHTRARALTHSQTLTTPRARACMPRPSLIHACIMMLLQGTIRARVESIQPREVQDLLQSMVDDGLLRSRKQRVITKRTSLLHVPGSETVRCYWARPAIQSGVL
jgi:hypothetical protein